MDGLRQDSPSGARSGALERRLLGALVALLGLHYGWLLLAGRIPRHHDSFYVFILEHLFLSQSSGGGGLLLWFPYSTHGMLSSWYVAANGFVHDAALLLGAGGGALPPASLFTLGMLFEDLLLLLGTWRLSRHYCRSPFARFFVVISVVGSSLWAEQMWHNHRPAYAIPMILSFLLDFLEDGRRSRLFLGINLLCLQLLGNLAYVALMSSLIVSVAVTVHVLVHRRSLRLRWPLLKPRPADAALLLANLAVLGCIAWTLTAGTGEITIGAAGRDPDGRVPLSGYLTYPGELDPVRYADLLLGISPSLDYTLYGGVAIVPFAMLALVLRPGRRTLVLAAWLTLVFLLSLGSLSAVGMPAYLLPPVRLFRYIALTSVHVRLPLFLLAGVGLDALLNLRGRLPAAVGRVALAFTTLGLVCGIFVVVYSGRLDDAPDVVRYLRTPNPRLAGRDVAASELVRSFAWTGAFALGLAAALFVRVRKPERSAAVIAALLILHAADVSRWRVDQTRTRTAPLTDDQREALRVGPLPYLSRRSTDGGDPRRLAAFPPRSFELEATYDTFENFFHRDPPLSTFITSHWMTPVDRLLRSYGGGPGLSAWQSLGGSPPRPPYDKITGRSADKLQVFAAAHGLATDVETAEFLNRPGCSGDALIVEGAGSAPDPGARERLEVPVAVESFDYNHLRVRVPLPPGRKGAWLYYADAWHPQWSATVNGREVPVSRAFLAYKAVPLEEGDNTVEFRMRAPSRVWTFRVAAANAAAWVMGILGLLAASLRPARASAVRAASGGA